MAKRNQLLVNGSERAIEQMKQEIAAELNIEISPDMTSRDAGRIGGNITQRLVRMAQEQLK